MRVVCKDKHWCGFVSFAALATILAHPVKLIHPIEEAKTDSGFSYNSHLMNSFILPRCGRSEFNPIHVLCCGNNDELFKNPSTSKMNHFVVLINPFANLKTTQAIHSGSADAFMAANEAITPKAKAAFPMAPIDDIREEHPKPHAKFTCSVRNLFPQCSPNSSLKDRFQT